MSRDDELTPSSEVCARSKLLCFHDSGAVRVDDVTVLLAENENGKSSFLRALEWFGSDNALPPEDRWDGADPEALVDVVSLVFDVTPPAAESLIDAGYTPPGQVRVVKDSEAHYAVRDAETGSELVSVPPIANQLLIQTRNQLLTELHKHAVEDGVPEAISLLEAAAGGSASTDPLEQHMRAVVLPAVPSHEAELERLLQEYIDAEEAVAAATDDTDTDALDALWDSLPRFLYFSDVEERVQDSVSYTQVAESPESHRTMINLAKLVNQDLVKISSRTGHQRLRLSEKVSADLTETTSFHWEGDRITFKVGFHDEEMVVLIDHKGRTQPPSRRSRGLQWFLGFHTNFKAEVTAGHAGAVLLLDEPGLHLHIKQQPKLVQFLDELSRNSQVIYSTHLPYMIPRSQIDRIRLLVSRSNGTVRIESDIQKVGSSHDALQPVRAALGMGIASAISLGARNLIVEGFADDYYVDAMRRACGRAGLPTLSDDCTILVTGGAGKKMLPLSSFIVSEKTRGAVLLDDDRAGRSAMREIQRHLGDRIPVVFTHEEPEGPPSGRSIEDLFERRYFVELLNEAYADIGTYNVLDADDLDPEKPICVAIDEIFQARAIGGFEKLRPARELQARVRLGREPDDQTLERFSGLFERLNAAESSRIRKTD